MPDLSYIKHTMRVFDIESNQIRACGSLCENTFPALIVISVQFNNITYMDVVKNLASRWPNVNEISIHNNQLQSLPDVDQSDRDGNTNQVMLEAHGNPYRCNQSMAWLADSWKDLDGDKVVFGRVMIWTSVLDDMRCQTPDYMEGFPIWQLGKTVCKHQTSSQIH